MQGHVLLLLLLLLPFPCTLLSSRPPTALGVRATSAPATAEGLRGWDGTFEKGLVGGGGSGGGGGGVSGLGLVERD